MYLIIKSEVEGIRDISEMVLMLKLILAFTNSDIFENNQKEIKRIERSRTTKV
jgi:hypothetical protein